MPSRSQSTRLIAVETPLGKDVLLLRSFTAVEQLSRPFRFELEMLSENRSIEPKNILGKNVTVRIDDEVTPTRYFNGYVSRWSQAPHEGGLGRYYATVSPWLWWLTRHADCRIFQEMSITEIIKKVFRDRGFSDFAEQLNESYEKVEYCVQYRETDFNFVSRLMESAGIFYWFEHENGKHTLTLGDSSTSYDYAGPDKKSVSLTYQEHAAGPGYVSRWEVEQRIQPGKYLHRDFDFKKPATSLETGIASGVEGADEANEIFDYPGEFTTSSQGEKLAHVRMEEMESQHEVAQGATNSSLVAMGRKFDLTGSPVHSNDGCWLVTSSTIRAEADFYEGGGNAGGTPFTCSFTAIRATTTFRPPRITPKPHMSGPQTAFVAGKNGEEIWTDEFGRIKVMFHWDRQSKGDEKSSCWMRVAQLWAGKRYGVFSIPRIGHEVIVEFLEGDPDRPIVTGCVYNAREAVPYPLPDEATKSGIKTNTSKGGGGFNEIRFEDKKDSEQIFINAQKELHVRVKENALSFIGKEQHEIIGESLYIQIKRERHEDVTEGSTLSVGKDTSVKIGGKSATKVTGDVSMATDANLAEKVSGNHTEEVTGNYFLKSSGGIVIECPTGITLKCGANSVVLSGAGVTVKGSLVTIDGGMTNINSGPGTPPTPGQAGRVQAPSDPQAPLEADSADPGELSEIVSRNAEVKALRPNSSKVAALQSSSSEETKKDEEPPKEKTWYEFQVLDAARKPMPDEPVTVYMKDGSTVKKKTDSQGVVRLEDKEEGDVERWELTNRDNEEWSNLGAGKRRGSGDASPEANQQTENSNTESPMMAEETKSDQNSSNDSDQPPGSAQGNYVDLTEQKDDNENS